MSFRGFDCERDKYRETFKIYYMVYRVTTNIRYLNITLLYSTILSYTNIFINNFNSKRFVLNIKLYISIQGLAL